MIIMFKYFKNNILREKKCFAQKLLKLSYFSVSSKVQTKTYNFSITPETNKNAIICV